MADDDAGGMSHQAVKDDGSEWARSRRVGERAGIARGQSGTSIAEEDPVTQRSRSSTGTEGSDQEEEPLIPVTGLASLEAENLSANCHDLKSRSAEHVTEKDIDDEMEDDIALLEYLSGAESDCYEVDRASRKGEDADDPTLTMTLSPRSNDESSGTPDTFDDLNVLSRSKRNPRLLTTVTHRMVGHAQEAPRQASYRVGESQPTSRDADEEAQSTEALRRIDTPRQSDGTKSNSQSEWIVCNTEDGLTYYYNQHTQESQWTNPTALGARIYSTEELFAAVSDKNLSDEGMRQLHVMLQSNMELQVVNDEGLTPLHVACNFQNEQAAALLVYYGAKLDARALRDDATPLILACRVESKTIVKLLVESNASLLAIDSNGNTALHVAASTGNQELVMCVLRGSDEALLSKKNILGETALHIAAKAGCYGILQSLLACGASVNVEDSQGRTPLILGILENHVKCVQLLQSIENTPSPSELSYYGSVERRKGETERDALSVLHSYLSQILPDPTTSESQTIWQLVDEMRDQMGALTASLQLSNDRVEQYRKQVQKLSLTLAANAEELRKEKAIHTAIESQLVKRELELDASRVSHQALSSRCDLLESIARNAQEKLGRERLEHTNNEKSMQEKLHCSLQGNAKVIEFCRQLQASWSERQQQFNSQQCSHDDQDFHCYPSYQAHFSSELESIQKNYHDLEAEKSTDIASGIQSREQYSRNYQQQHPQEQHDRYHHHSEPYRFSNAPEILDPPSPLLDANGTRKLSGSITPHVSPTRVGAVWNRFFENVGHASETRGPSISDSSQSPSLQSGLPIPSHSANSLVFTAIRKNDLEKLQQVLMRGISPNQRDVAEKGTPLHLACELGDFDSVMLLSEYAADLEAPDEAGNSPLLAACCQGNFECVKFLLQSAVNFHAVNENGDSALHLAAWDGSISCVMILLDYGVDVMATNQFGLTALGNLKTRSPMRHKFDDLLEEHPIRRILVVLEKAEQYRLHQLIEEQSTSTEGVNEPTLSKLEASEIPSKTSWTQWLLGFRGFQTNGSHLVKEKNKQQKSDAGDTSTSTSNTEHEVDSEDADDYSTFEDSLLSETKYEPLAPPPDVEEALRRAKVKQLSGSYEKPEPTFSKTRQELPKHMIMTPSAPIYSRPQHLAAPTKIRARYVDTFNTSQ